MEYLLLLTLIFAPTYALRFNIFGLPTNLLMMWVIFLWVVFFVWIVAKKQGLMFFTAVRNISQPILIFTGLFFLSGLISLFSHGFNQAKFGQFLVLFLQPISLFFMGRFVFEQNPKAKSYLLLTTYYLLALAGLYAIFQYFTLLGLPPAYWGNQDEPKRALSFFLHPNFYALWSAPLLALLIPDYINRAKGIGLRAKLPMIAWLLGAVGLLLSFSRAGWLGLGMAILVYLIVAADKKIRKISAIAIVVIAIIIISVPNLRWRFVLPFYGEKSAVSRLSLWHTGWIAIKESPLTGLGLTGFANNWQRLNTDPGLADTSHNFPHNIFLDFWVETGLLGLVSFLGLSAILIYRGLRFRVIPDSDPGSTNIDSRLRGNDTFNLAITLFIICLIFQGLIDNPYFKNDLAIVFWMVLVLI